MYGGVAWCLLLAPSIFPLTLCSLSQETNLYRPCQGHLWLLAVSADGEPGRERAGRENIKLRVFIPLAPFLQGHLGLAHTSIYGQGSPPGNLLYMTVLFQVSEVQGISLRRSVNLEKIRKYILFSNSALHVSPCQRPLHSLKLFFKLINYIYLAALVF